MWFTRHNILPAGWKPVAGWDNDLSEDELLQCKMAILGFTNQIPAKMTETFVESGIQVNATGDIAIILMGGSVVLLEPIAFTVSKPVLLRSPDGLTLKTGTDVKILCYWLYPGEWISQKISRPYHHPNPQLEQVATPRRIAEIMYEKSQDLIHGRVVDLFCGLGGIGEVYLEAGHSVLFVDSDPTLKQPLTRWLNRSSHNGRIRIQDFSGVMLKAGDHVCASPPVMKEGSVDHKVFSRFLTCMSRGEHSSMSLLIPWTMTTYVLKTLCSSGVWGLVNSCLVSVILPRSKEAHTADFKFIGMEILTLARHAKLLPPDSPALKALQSSPRQ